MSDASSILTNKELIDALIYIISSQYFYKFVFLLLLIMYSMPLGKAIIKIVEFFLNIPKRKLEAISLENKKTELQTDKYLKEEMFSNFKIAIEEVKQHNALIDTILKSLQLSPSNYKYELLSERVREKR